MVCFVRLLEDLFFIGILMLMLMLTLMFTLNLVQSVAHWP